MAYRIDSIAAALGAEVVGDGALEILRAAEPGMAGPDDLALAMSADYGDALRAGQARAAVLWPGADWQALGLKAAIFVPRGRLAMARLTAFLDPGMDFPQGIHATAIIDPTARLGAGVAVGPFTVIGRNVVIGAGTRIAGQATIDAGTVVGADCVILSGVRIGRNVRIGARVMLHPNAVIGADGFSFVTATPSHVEVARKTLGEGEMPVTVDPTWHRIHSLGAVEIGDDVEIGANATVDAGTVRATQVGSGSKIDNLVHVGHNVIVGRHCLLAGQSGIAGSTRIGDRVVLGGKAGVGDNLTIGDDVVIGGASNIMSSVPAGRIMMGFPSMQMQQQVESYKALRRLPRFLRDMAPRQKAVSKTGESD